MKKLLTLFFAAAAIVSCNYDDSDLWNAVNGLDARLARLEKVADDTNKDIRALQELVGALRSQVTISSVETTADGYAITFSNGEKAVITSGRDGRDGTNAPAVSVRKDDGDGVYYWTLDGEWLTADGHKIPAEGRDGAPAVAPKIRINTDTEEWEVSADGGQTWEPVGPATSGSGGDYLFSDVDVRDDLVIFTLSDGTVFEIPRTTGISFAIDTEGADVVKILAGQTKVLGVAANGVAGYTIAKPDGWKAAYSGTSLSITAPADSNPYAEREGEIAIHLVSANGTSLIVKLKVKVNAVLTHTITFEGEEWEPLVISNISPVTSTWLLGIRGDDYTWTDATTQFMTSYPPMFGMDGYPWFVSSYNSNNEGLGGSYDQCDLYVYNPVNANATTGGGNNSSDNFIICYGYMETAHPEYGDGRPILKFKDNKPRVVKSVYVNSTCYFLNVASNGNGLSPALGEGEDVILHATGYDAEGHEINTVTMAFATKDHLITEWTEWDLSPLGEIVTLKVNMTGGTDNGYGFSLPAYYAFDDITIEWVD